MLTTLKLVFASLSLTTSSMIAFLFFINKELRTPTFRLVLQLQIADAIFAMAQLINSNQCSQFQAFLINYSRESSLLWTFLFAFNMYVTIVVNRQHPPNLRLFYVIAMGTWRKDMKIGIPLVLSVYPYFFDGYAYLLISCWIGQDYLVVAIFNYLLICIFVIVASTTFYYKTFKFLLHVTEQRSYRLFVYPSVLTVCQIWTIIGVLDWKNSLADTSTLDYFSVIFASSQGFCNSFVYGLTPQVLLIMKSWFRKGHEKISVVELLPMETKKRSTSVNLPAYQEKSSRRTRETFSYSVNRKGSDQQQGENHYSMDSRDSKDIY